MAAAGLPRLSRMVSGQRRAGPADDEPSDVDERSSRIQRRLEPWMLAAALLVIPTIVIEDSATGAPWSVVAGILNWTTWLAFLVEVIVMLTVVPDRRAWIRSHPLDLAIIVLTPPFASALMQGMRAIRLLRLTRLLRLARIFMGMRNMFTLTGIKWAATLGLAIIVGGGAAFTAVETGQHLSAWDGLWFSVTTATTVGYGDVSPQTDGGRIIAMIIMGFGIGFIALLTGALAERFIRADVEADVDVIEAEEADLLRELGLIRERLFELEEQLRGAAPTPRRPQDSS